MIFGSRLRKARMGLKVKLREEKLEEWLEVRSGMFGGTTQVYTLSL